MIRKSTVTLLLAASFFMNGCDNTANSERTGVSTGGGDKGLGSLSGIEDISGYLEKSAWNGIEMDLEKFLYDRKGTITPFKMNMKFEDGKVDAIADCFEITARYRMSGDEISFSRVSSAKPVQGSCEASLDADEAVANFLVGSYKVSVSIENSAVFEGLDIDGSVTLKR